jgi:hypothetical protein
MSRDSKIQVAWSLAASVFWVVALWNFWERGPMALGLNASIYLGGLFALFLWSAHRRGISLRRTWVWSVPLGLIILSFFLYNNPFLKMVSLLILPPLFALFYIYAHREGQTEPHWSWSYLTKSLGRALSAVAWLGQSARAHARLLAVKRTPDRGRLALRIVVGLMLLALISLTVVIPLLASADSQFAEAVRGLTDWLQAIIERIELTTVAKIVWAAIFSVVTMAALLAWGRTFAYQDPNQPSPVDSVIAGIVLAGLLALYLLFLGIQVQRLAVTGLPYDFNETVALVKSGFWQLLSLSVLNIILYFTIFRRTGRTVQRLLTAFTLSSLLLLLSAAHRMGLYVIFHGFSYEKLFATYTVIYCAAVFVWLIRGLFSPVRHNVVRFMCLLFLWMFAVATVLPIEQLILRSNVALAQMPGSRVRLYELTMLSPDVLNTVERFQATGRLTENAYYHDQQRRSNPSQAGVEPDWSWWVRSRREQVRAKAWYEKTLVDWSIATD